MPLVLLVILLWLGSLIAVMLPSNARNAESTAAGVISLAALVQAALYFPAIARGEVIEQRITWLPTLGLNLVRCCRVCRAANRHGGFSLGHGSGRGWLRSRHDT